MRPSNSPIINAIACNANINSTPVWATDIVRFSVQAFVPTGTVNGTLQLQVSNDIASGKPANQFVPTNWANLGTAVTFNTTGPANVMVPAAVVAPWFDAIESSYEYIRVVFTDSSSGTATGFLTVRLVAKAL